MNINEAARILVLDPIHGAEVIADELKALGKAVQVFNPYSNSSLDQSESHNYDLVIAPVHLNPNFEIVKHALEDDIPFMSHHEAVKELAAINNLFEGIKVLEVTGTVRKTSVCELMCQLVKNNKVLSHTSSITRFKSPENEILFPRLGSTPANVLKVMEIARGKNLKPDIAVFEISLGLTGIGDVAVITSLEEDYKVAGGTKDAVEVKKASLRNYAGKDRSVVVHPGLLLSDLNVSGNTYGAKDKTLWIEDTKVIFDGVRTINGASISGEIAFAPIESYVATDYYRGCLEAAFCAVLSLGIPPEELNIEDLAPVKGRLKLEKIEGRVLIDNSNSGTKLKFLAEITELARRISEKMVLIVGVESQYVCEGMDLDELKEVVKNGVSDFVEILIVGEEFKGKIAGKNVFFTDSLDMALEKAIADSDEGSVIISNVKTWR